MIENMSWVNDNNDELIPLFPSPVFVCSYQENFDKELEWIRNQNYIKKNWVEEGNQLVIQSSDTFILDNPELSSINVFLKEKISDYLKEIYESDDELVITQSWLNKVSKGSLHPEHRHPNSIISGVWYPQINDESPVITFRSESYQMTGHSNGHGIALKFKQWNNFNCGSFFLPMKKGQLVLFPSNLLHHVPENKSDIDRISLSFNTWVKGSLGDIRNLTYLPLDRCV